MLAVLNMDLEPVRVVLSNEVNRITVCEDRRRAQGGLYTVVSVTAPHARRDAARLTAAGTFGGSADFVGSAALGDALHLVFRYRPESLLASRESIYGVDFVHRRTMAANFLAAAAGTQLPPDAAMLLLAGRCINLGESGEVYFNYYLDFADYRSETTQPEFCRAAAAYVFDILCRDYARSAGGQIPDYPGELQAFYRKTQVGGFTSLGALLAAVRALPDTPRPPHRGLLRLWDSILALLGVLKKHSMAIFLALLVGVTILYAAYQIAIRVSAGNAEKANTTYGGMQTIGDVTLTDANE